MTRLAECIDRGKRLVSPAQKEVARYVATIRKVNATLDPETNRCATRKRIFSALARELLLDTDDAIHQHMSHLMVSFSAGLFVGGARADWPCDNLDLERWFRLPKGHERRIHGRCHAGVRIVQEGETMLLALDAHRLHPQPFTEADLRAYRDAEPPKTQSEAIRRRKIMRAARSTKKRAALLRSLEKRYAAAPPQ